MEKNTPKTKGKIILLIGLLFLSFFQVQSLAQIDPSIKSELVLTGNTPKFSDTVYAAIIDLQRNSSVGDAVLVKDQKFTIKTQLPTPAVYMLMIGDLKDRANQHYFNIFLENVATDITILKDGAKLQVNKGASTLAFNDLLAHFGGDFDLLRFIGERKNNLAGNAQPTDSIDRARSEIVRRIGEKMPVFLKGNSQTMVAPLLVNIVLPLQYPFEQVQGWVDLIDSAAMQNTYGAAVLKHLEVEGLLGYGRPAPTFSQANEKGTPVNLESFRGKYVLLDFWASWCGPCRRENPTIVKAFNRFKDKNFTILGISLDGDPARWTKAIADDQLTWTHVSDLGIWNNAVAKLYRVQSIPQNFLLDPEGKIIAKNLRGEDLEAKLESLFSK